MTKIFRIFFYNEFGCKNFSNFFLIKVFDIFFLSWKIGFFDIFFPLFFTTKIFRIFLVRIFPCFWPKKIHVNFLQDQKVTVKNLLDQKRLQNGENFFHTQKWLFKKTTTFQKLPKNCSKSLSQASRDIFFLTRTTLQKWP